MSSALAAQQAAAAAAGSELEALRSNQSALLDRVAGLGREAAAAQRAASAAEERAAGLQAELAAAEERRAAEAAAHGDALAAACAAAAATAAAAGSAQAAAALEAQVAALSAQLGVTSGLLAEREAELVALHRAAQRAQRQVAAAGEVAAGLRAVRRAAFEKAESLEAELLSTQAQLKVRPVSEGWGAGVGV